MTEALLDVEQLPDSTMRITIRGEIDLSNVAAVEQNMLDAISNQLSEVVVDLSGVTYVDSAGLRVLFTLGTRLEALQIRFRLVVPLDSPPRRVIDLSGIGSVAAVQP
jgi:stage II sporulation protein AA (anti-sigma F factor antagonist)